MVRVEEHLSQVVHTWVNLEGLSFNTIIQSLKGGERGGGKRERGGMIMFYVCILYNYIMYMFHNVHVLIVFFSPRTSTCTLYMHSNHHSTQT